MFLAHKVPTVGLLALLLVLAGCSEDNAITKTANPTQSGTLELDDFAQVWDRAYEEEVSGSGIQVFHPKGFLESPPSWFRMRYSFEASGECEWLVLHPADAHSMTAGYWTRDSDDEMTIVIFNHRRTAEPISFKIVELTSDIMRVVVLSP